MNDNILMEMIVYMYYKGNFPVIIQFIRCIIS